MLAIFINSFVLPLLKKGDFALVKIEWLDEEVAFDVWPQYAVLAAVADETLKSGKEANLKEALGESFDKMKSLFDENCMKEDFLEWVGVHISGENKDKIL